MDRGDVHLVQMALPDRVIGSGTTIHDKYVVVLRGREPTESEVPVVIASTDRRKPGQPVRTFEVAVGVADGFHHDTLIDCRWVHTIPKRDLSPATHRFKLSQTVMREISISLVSGLQMR